MARVLCGTDRVILCAIKGKRIKGLSGSYNSLVAGDIVETVETDPGKGLVTSLVPRRNSFGRYNEKGRAEQAIAANIDAVFCVSSPELPPFRPRFIDRVAVMAEQAGLPFCIIMNKTDLGVPADVEERLEGYRKLGYGVIYVSAHTGEGIDALSGMLRGRTSVLSGQSGVGKSSIINILLPGTDRKVQDVSVKYNRGRHTTTMAEMLSGSGGMRIIDTPGIRRLALRCLDVESLPAYFPEIAPLVKECAFGSSCSHIGEEGCAVIRAVGEGLIHPDRYESYARIREELDVPAAWKKQGVRDPGRRDRGRISGTKSRTNARRIRREDHEDE